ncbi:unnamed protein product [Oppiella nova]|uniref:F-box domain-containing protein n=1 Tax=Oppiella nova TaxID=334625 RepID=A0A7R9LKV8_9ACAR|nr:unnamed protein product [Oppiella nova]CAG2164594.1 unnamed protein product [Oppiella nova]
MNINDLNDDCLSIIFSYIPLKQLFIDRRVCRHWRQTIDNLVANERHLVYNQAINGTKRDQYFYKYKDNVDSLLDLNQFECVVQLMPKLTALTLNGIKANDAMLPIVATSGANITRLHLMSGEESLTFVGFKYLVRRFPGLTHLDLPNCQLDDDLIHIITTNLHQLVHLNFGTDRNRALKNYRLSRFTGHTLRHIGPRIRSLMIGESMYWDEQLVQSLMASSARHVTTLRIHLIKLKALRTVCEGMPQLKHFYCSFNGGDINTHENNVGCVRHLQRLHSLEVLELIDDGRHHCGINGCYSVYTLDALMEAMNGMSQLKVLRLIDFDNWHSFKPNIDPLLSELRRFCPNLRELGISAGLFQLKAESYGLIGLLNVSVLTVQGDSCLNVGEGLNHSNKHNYLTDEVVVELLKSSPGMRRLKVENCVFVGEEAIAGCLQESATRSRQRIELIFSNTRLNSANQLTAKVPQNVSLVVTKEVEAIDLEDYSDGSSSFDSSDSDSIHLFSEDDDDVYNEM